MAADLDDVVAELQNIRKAIEELEMGSGGGGDGDGAAATGPSGRRGKAGGSLSSFKGYMAAASSGLSGAVDIADRTGILAGIRTKNLGGSNAAAAGSVAQRVTSAASQTTLGKAFLANTGQFEERQSAAVSGVAGFAEQAALGGSPLSDAQINEGLARQKKVSGIRQGEKNRVANLANAGSRGERGEALAKDAENFAKAARGAAELANKFSVLNGLLSGLPGLLSGDR